MRKGYKNVIVCVWWWENEYNSDIFTSLKGFIQGLILMCIDYCIFPYYGLQLHELWKQQV